MSLLFNVENKKTSENIFSIYEKTELVDSFQFGVSRDDAEDIILRTPDGDGLYLVLLEYLTTPDDRVSIYRIAGFDTIVETTAHSKFGIKDGINDFTITVQNNSNINHTCVLHAYKLFFSGKTPSDIMVLYANGNTTMLNGVKFCFYSTGGFTELNNITYKSVGGLTGSFFSNVNKKTTSSFAALNPNIKLIFFF